MNRKTRRSKIAEASSQKVPGKNHPVNRLERMIQRTKQRLAKAQEAAVFSKEGGPIESSEGGRDAKE